jgi:hypothetical protein
VLQAVSDFSSVYPEVDSETTVDLEIISAYRPSFISWATKILVLLSIYFFTFCQFIFLNDCTLLLAFCWSVSGFFPFLN